MPITRPACAHCGATHVLLRKQRVSNGTYQIAWHCPVCGRWAELPVVWLKHEAVRALLQKYDTEIDDVPVITDYSDSCPCIVCGNPGEWHHWAPQSMAHLFGNDWMRWPTAPLCPEHHRLWHDLVTPNLRRLPK